MDISNRHFRDYLLSYLKADVDFLFATAWANWSITFSERGLMDHDGFVTVCYHDGDKDYCFSMDSLYYDRICQDYRNNKINKILC